MGAWLWVVIVVAVVLVAGIAVWTGRARAQRGQLRDRFGPEYDRAVERHGDRRQAEADLIERARRRDELELRPLEPQARDHFRSVWAPIQSSFVDRPSDAVRSAGALLAQVMKVRGYPVDDVDDRADLVSVDHPGVVEGYRQARDIQHRNEAGLATTDELRQAVLLYRALFRDLLDVGSADHTGEGATTHHGQPRFHRASGE